MLPFQLWATVPTQCVRGLSVTVSSPGLKQDTATMMFKECCVSSRAKKELRRLSFTGKNDNQTPRQRHSLFAVVANGRLAPWYALRKGAETARCGSRTSVRGGRQGINDLIWDGMNDF